MRRALVLTLLAACRDPSAPPAAPEAPAAAARIPDLEKRVRTLEEHLAKTGLRVPAQIPSATARQAIEEDAVRKQATAKPQIEPPRKGKLPWKSRIEPPAKVWEVATGALATDAAAPPRLLVVVDHSGFLDGYFPVTPAEDLAPAEGTPEQRAAALERNAQVLEGRRSVVDTAAAELANQRKLVAAAARLGPQHLRIDPGSRRATLTFAEVSDADRAAVAPVLKELGLTAVNAATRVDLTVAGP